MYHLNNRFKTKLTVQLLEELRKKYSSCREVELWEGVVRVRFNAFNKLNGASQIGHCYSTLWNFIPVNFRSALQFCMFHEVLRKFDISYVPSNYTQLFHCMSAFTQQEYFNTYMLSDLDRIGDMDRVIREVYLILSDIQVYGNRYLAYYLVT